MRTGGTWTWSTLTCLAMVATVTLTVKTPSADAAGGYVPSVPEMAESHYEGTSTRLSDGRVLVAGGEPNIEGDPPVTGGGEIYTSTSYGGYWDVTGDMVVRRSNHAATLLADGRVLVTGGYNLSGGFESVASTEIWNPATNVWSATAPMSRARSNHQAVLLSNGKVLVLGGYESPTTAELYNPATNSWSPAAPLPSATEQVFAAVPLNNGQVLVTLSGAAVRSQLYTPSTNSWAGTGTPTGYRPLATKLADGRVLVLSHWGQGLSEVFDPASRTWTATAPMSFECGSSLATVSTGRVIVLCPSEGHGSGEDFAQMYDPQSNKWIDTAVGVGWEGEMITPLANAKALVTGGTTYESHLDAAVVFVDGVPGVPSEVSAGSGNGSAQVSWLAPGDIGTSPVTGYTVRGFTTTGETVTQQVAASVRTVTFTALTNGASYGFTVSARNAIGTGQEGYAQPVVPRAVTCTISGTAAANTLTGTPQADVICGRGGNDIIKGQGGNDTIIGGAGIDSVDYANATAPITANLGTGLATGQGTDTVREVENINGSPYADKLTGDAGPNRLSGKGGKDTLAGQGGPDAMYGGESDDQIQFTGDLDAGYGGLGIDAASFAVVKEDESVRVNLTTGRSIIGGYYWVERSTLTEIENVIGGPQSDAIVGSPGPNLLRGGGGYDTIQGAEGNDKLYGDAGGDTLSGGPGTDSCAGGTDDDNADSTCETTVGVP